GEPIDFTPQTFRVESDAGITFDVESIKTLMAKGREKVHQQIKNSTDESLDEEIKTFMGDKTRKYMLYYLLHHSSYHLGQAEQALKKGKLY
ncbi:MAG: hypothetical protein HYZ42_17140, partial [Bacteroidetes bacterium]|nr:hypothetical protein [Bacteroidota bacterium]